MNSNRLSTFLAALFATQATGLALSIFVMCRGDHDMKLLALGAAISQTTALMSTASTMLVGKDLTIKPHDPNDNPPGSIQTERTTIQIPPITTPQENPA